MYVVADVDECADGSAGCSADASCTNFAGGFTCTCNDGYDGDGTTCDGKYASTITNGFSTVASKVSITNAVYQLQRL